MKNKYLVVFTTCPDEATAKELADALVGERLAACVNRLPGVRSTYRWEGEVRDDAEVLLIVKTSADRVGNLCARIEQLHPYQVPEAIAVDIGAGSERYLDWLGQTLSHDEPTLEHDSTQEP